MNTVKISKNEVPIMNIGEIKTAALSMADAVYEIIELTQEGFMENKSEILSGAINKEHQINQMEKLLTKNIMELSKDSNDKAGLSVMEQMIEALERMGDEVASMIERIEVKVAEKLLFSEKGVEQFNETYDTMKKSVAMMREYLRNKSEDTRKRVVDNGFQVKELVERYRKEHSDRLIHGLCTPMGANMYFDMLDFTGNLARHASNIVKLF
ncbi:MAG: PhoU domain-containing protein [Candidatus Omnitrophota bacterium]|jgi:phosphate:Na+ symporter